MSYALFPFKFFRFVFVESYFHRSALRDSIITEFPSRDLFLSVVIPSYNEDNILQCLKSLLHCDSPACSVEVLVVINYPQNASSEIQEKSKKCADDLRHWAIQHRNEKLKFFILLEELPVKDAGVGLARKIGMDEAARRFDFLKREEGVIVCLDADCEVSGNYLCCLQDHFMKNNLTPAASIRFEHRLQNLSPENSKAIILYEIFLRYYINALRYSGFPYAFQTVGSSMAVRNVIYQKQGGMNKRKAGEDFYFLQKIFPLGNFTEVNSCCVYPSARMSDRVPFGTGKSVAEQLNGKILLFYDFEIFRQFKIFNEQIIHYGFSSSASILLKTIPKDISDYFSNSNFEFHLNQIKANVRDSTSFIKRFYAWLDGFRVLKMVHSLSDNRFPRKAISATDFSAFFSPGSWQEPNELLKLFREKDRLFQSKNS